MGSYAIAVVVASKIVRIVRPHSSRQEAQSYAESYNLCHPAGDRFALPIIPFRGLRKRLTLSRARRTTA